MTRLVSALFYILAIVTAIASTAPVDPENVKSRFCTSDDRFVTPFFHPNDCWGAITDFKDNKAWPEGRSLYEFLPPGSTGPNTTQYPVARTMQRWTHGSCTLAITTLSAFNMGELPQLGFQTYPLTDVASYEALCHQVEHMGHNCLERWPPLEDVNGTVAEIIKPAETQRKTRRGDGMEGPENFRVDAGFAVAGWHDAVGIFLWDTASIMNARFPRLPGSALVV